jgi:pyruvate-formate lyase
LKELLIADRAKNKIAMMMNNIGMYPSYRNAVHTGSVLTINFNIVCGKYRRSTPDAQLLKCGSEKAAKQWFAE